MTTVLFWFTHDLRLSDNEALAAANENADHLVCCYTLDLADTRAGFLGLPALGPHRFRFLIESLTDLKQQLADYGHTLVVLVGNPFETLPGLIDHVGVDSVWASTPIAHDEQQRWHTLTEQHSHVDWHTRDGHGLYTARQWPFDAHDYPHTFSRFRRRVENTLNVCTPTPAPVALAPPPSGIDSVSAALPDGPDQSRSPFQGGRGAGWRQLNAYCSGNAAHRYKTVRNALDGWETSSKWSPWLAAGCLSVREIMQRIRDYEDEWGANESTYWLFFELLWREYYLGAAYVYGAGLFHRAGIEGVGTARAFDASRFERWRKGTTDYPLVNAIMNQLRHTGYISNRARQIAASAWVNELDGDWRYGAAWFQTQLIDYEVGSNWGNWQYIAGVGFDPQGGRHFNLEKQARQFDAEGDYQARWGRVTAQ